MILVYSKIMWKLSEKVKELEEHDKLKSYLFIY